MIGRQAADHNLHFLGPHMKLESPIDPSFSRPAVAAFVLAGCALFSGCATNDSMTISGTGITATDSARLTRSGFLSDYARLKPTTWGQGIECWRDSKLDARSYDKVLICLLYTSPSPRDRTRSRMPSSA